VLAADTDPQVERWDAERKAGLFAKVFAATPALIWTGTAPAARRPAQRKPRARLRLAAAG
jgi:hypothetical protein